MRRLWLVLCSLVLGSLQLHAQQLSIGQIPFRLGMSMQEAIALVHDPIYLDAGGNNKATATWMVREKHDENYILIGTIFFRNGKVESLRRDLRGFLTKDANDVGHTLFQALDQLKHDDPSLSINTRRVFMSSQTGEVKTITIGTGPRRIEITIPDTIAATTEEMTISEVLTSVKPVLSK